MRTSLKLLQILFFFLLMMQTNFAQWMQAQGRQADTSMKSKNDFVERKRPEQKPIPIYPLTHPSYLMKNTPLPPCSFYKSRANWQHIIDSTWGPGLPTTSKLQIFDNYAKALTEKFDGFKSLGISWASWDSIKTAFRTRINDSTSRGAFAALMSKFAWILRDGHTWAWDTVVMHTPVAPGVPLLNLSPFATAEHFGAILTALPDSTALVLRTVPNHPLGLQPGDIVLGYEGVPWKHLMKELIDAGVPIYSAGTGAASAQIHSLIRNAGNNWHLFSTIDILQYATGDTLHLSVQPLQGLHSASMMSNEQLQISGIPFAQFWLDTYPGHGDQCSYGVIPGTRIGYIQLVSEWPQNQADQQFYEAITALWNSDGLIIDMRWNSGGWALFDAAFTKMFSKRLYTLSDAYRTSSTSLGLSSIADSGLFVIPGGQGMIFDKPIAVLLGPTCVSMGDITAQRLRYHPMVRFIGRSTIASLGDNENLSTYPDWWLHYSKSDMYHVSQSGVYLNRREFPVDEHVWLTPEGVAKGEDDVVKRALEWISTITYAHDAAVDHGYFPPGQGNVNITASLTNPLNHTAVLSAILTDAAATLRDSVLLYNDGLHGDGSAGDSLWGCSIKVPSDENMFNVSLRTDDIIKTTFRRLPNVASFSTAGPLTVDSISYKLRSNYYNYSVSLFVKNHCTKTTIKNVKVNILSNDPWVRGTASVNLPDIPPDTTVASTGGTILYIDSLFPGYFNLKFDIMSNGWTYWTDSAKVIVTGIKEETIKPLSFKLEQNYPNPFNPTTNIQYSIASRQLVELKIFNVLGQEIAILVKEEKPAGTYHVEFSARGGSAYGGNAANLPSGVYFYRIQAGSFNQVRKMLLIK